MGGSRGARLTPTGPLYAPRRRASPHPVAIWSPWWTVRTRRAPVGPMAGPLGRSVRWRCSLVYSVDHASRGDRGRPGWTKASGRSVVAPWPAVAGAGTWPEGGRTRALVDV